MKKLSALLLSVALFSPAFAQQSAFQGMHPKPPANLVTPATKPILLHTGKSITPEQVQQLLESSIQEYAAGKSTFKKFTVSSNPTGSVVFNLNMMKKDGVGYAVLNNPISADFSTGDLFFGPGAANNLTFVVDVQPNTAYVLVMKLWIADPDPKSLSPSNAQLTFSPAWSNTNAQTIDVIPGGNEIAYSFVTGAKGSESITISSPSSNWVFASCKISSLSAQ
ncbi:MAG: hypothetical protein ABSB30_13630 [Terracidiphilus sp.]|jgi:hypothetical protein